MEQHPKENLKIQAIDGNWLNYTDFALFLNKNPKETFFVTNNDSSKTKIIQNALNIAIEKLGEIERALILETDVARKFDLKYKRDDLKKEIKNFEQQLNTFRSTSGANKGIKTYTASGENKYEITIFVSYAKEDNMLRELLTKGVLKHLKNKGNINLKFWVDKDITMGEDWQARIEESLQTTNAALLLVSSNFAASDYVNEEELLVFLERKQSEGYLIMPVLVRDYDFQASPLSKLNFFRPYFKDFHEFENNLPKANNILPFEQLVETRGISEMSRNAYYKTLAQHIQNAVLKKLAS